MLEHRIAVAADKLEAQHGKGGSPLQIADMRIRSDRRWDKDWDVLVAVVAQIQAVQAGCTAAELALGEAEQRLAVLVDG